MPTPPPNITRRSFLRSAALAALAQTGCSTLPRAHRDDIDAHVHVWSSDTHRYPLAPGFGLKDMAPRSFTPHDLFAQCRPNGVGRIVLIQMSFYHFDNRYLLDSIAYHPDVFRGVAIVDETRANLHDTMKSLKAQGIRGFRVYSEPEQVAAWPHSVGMKKLWTYAADMNLTLCLLTEPEALPGVHRMCQAYPHTRVAIDHFARIGMKSPIRRRNVDELCRLAECPHTYVKTSAFYALGAKKAPYTDLGPMIHRLRDAYGASRLMWGSDCPFQLQDGQTYGNSIALIRDRLPFLTVEDKHWMLGGTAEKVFFA